MTRDSLLREAQMLRACTCGLPDHEWVAIELEQKAALLTDPEPAPLPVLPSTSPEATLCAHGCCLPAVCDWCGDCSFHAGGAA